DGRWPPVRRDDGRHGRHRDRLLLAGCRSPDPGRHLTARLPGRHGGHPVHRAHVHHRELHRRHDVHPHRPAREARVTGVVGLIGVGAMGRGFAKDLVLAGFTVRGPDRDPRALEALHAVGGTPTGSPAEAATGATWLITSLPGHEEVSDVLFGSGGALTTAEAGIVVIDTSTSLPKQSRSLGERLARAGLRFVDASVSGTGAT